MSARVAVLIAVVVLSTCSRSNGTTATVRSHGSAPITTLLGVDADGDTAGPSASTVADQSPAADRSTTVEPATVEPVRWASCGDGFECAEVQVPLDHDVPAGRRIGLSVIRRPSSSSDPIGSLFVNPGGPGSSGVDYLRNTDAVNASLRPFFHVVGFDPRGVGGSSPLICGDAYSTFDHLDPTPDDDAEQDALDAAARGFADACETRHGPLLPHVGTDSVARDLELLRQAVEDDQLNYLGFSYGTDIGLAYAKRYPEQIRTMVLDGVADPNQGLEEFLIGQAIALDAAIDEIFDACDESEDCPITGPAAELYGRLSKQLDDEPIAGDSGPIGQAELDNAALRATYDPRFWPLFHQALSDAERGDGDGLASLASTLSNLTSFDLYTAVLCIDSPHPVGAAKFRAFAERASAAAPRYGASVANELLPCAFWPTTPTGNPGPVAAVGAAPILVINKTRDAATPFANAQRVARNLESGILVVHEADGHTSFGKAECIDTIVLRYLVDLDAPSNGTVCS